MDSDRCTYWESRLDSLDDSTPVSIFPYIGKMAGSEEASVSRMSGFSLRLCLSVLPELPVQVMADAPLVP